MPLNSRLGGVVVSVLATGPRGRGFEPGQSDGILRATKIRSTPSSRRGSKAGRSHVVRLYGCKRTLEVSRGWIDYILVSFARLLFQRRLW
jgi:hypothetical protein